QSALSGFKNGDSAFIKQGVGAII
ncbi:hypothetical protein MGSAQ_002802, partial [marine sediment metagenome]